MNEGRVVSLPRLTLLLALLVAILLPVVQVQATYLFSRQPGSTKVTQKAPDLQLPELPQLKRWPATEANDGAIDLFLAPVTTTLPAARSETVIEPSTEMPIVLTAVAASSENRRALLEVGSKREVISAREGTLVGGWKVIEIEPDQVTLERGTTRKVLFFSDILSDEQ